MAADKRVASTGQTAAEADNAKATPSLETPDAAAQSPPVGPPAQPAIIVDDSNVAACYSNFCRVSSTPEELILDLGLNPSPMQTGDVTVRISQRIILNHYTAKRLLSALSTTLQRHEQTFGVLETDVRRRVRAM